MNYFDDQRENAKENEHIIRNIQKRLDFLQINYEQNPKDKVNLECCQYVSFHLHMTDGIQQCLLLQWFC